MCIRDSLKTEHAKMWDLSAHGLFADTKFDYQVSLFSMNISNKLTQLSGGNYTYWANTGSQKNKGLELSLGYVENFDSGFFKKIEPYFNYSLYDFKYDNFVTNGKNYSGKEVVGVPKHKASLGLDFTTPVSYTHLDVYKRQVQDFSVGDESGCSF